MKYYSTEVVNYVHSLRPHEKYAKNRNFIAILFFLNWFLAVLPIGTVGCKDKFISWPAQKR